MSARYSEPLCSAGTTATSLLPTATQGREGGREGVGGTSEGRTVFED